MRHDQPIPYTAHLTHDYFDLGDHELREQASEDAHNYILANEGQIPDWRPESARGEEI